MTTQRKTFRHTFVPEIELNDRIVDGKRYYFLPDGRKFKSVTTIISEKSDKSSLLEWRKRVGEQEANRITAVATRRGTAIHSLCEAYVLNEPNYTDKKSVIDIDTFNGLKGLLDKHVDDVFGIELPLYSTMLRAAGRSDLIAKFDGTLSIIDFKTSTRLKKEQYIENYFIQSTVYSIMFEEIYGIKVPQLAIMMAVDNEEPQLFVKKTKDYYSRVIDFFCDEKNQIF
jgi:Holliday junction resolvase-like predicted endonuclease